MVMLAAVGIAFFFVGEIKTVLKYFIIFIYL